MTMISDNEELETARSMLIKLRTELRDDTNALSARVKHMDNVSVKTAAASKQLVKAMQTADTQSAAVDQAIKSLNDLSKAAHATAWFIKVIMINLYRDVDDTVNSLLLKLESLDYISEARDLNILCAEMMLRCESMITDVTDTDNSELLVTAARVLEELDAAAVDIESSAAGPSDMNLDECLKIISHARETVLNDLLNSSRPAATATVTATLADLRSLSSVNQAAFAISYDYVVNRNRCTDDEDFMF